MSFLLKAKHFLLAILFPPVCIHCGKDLGNQSTPHHLCNNCFASIHLHSAFFCPVCVRRLPNSQHTCHSNANYFLAAATDYQNPVIRALIWHFKYQKWRSLASVLGNLLAQYLNGIQYDLSDYVLIPIPLYTNRQRERGFNQSELVAQYVSEKLFLPIFSDTLIRVKPTHTQTTLKDSDKKITNVADCFQVSNLTIIQNKKIIVVDDVFTSGATMNEAVRTLKFAGAKKIIALVIAKAN
ncbi:MAG TPA: ComF family protein [Candidatus Paceibacterota bacterium]